VATTTDAKSQAIFYSPLLIILLLDPSSVASVSLALCVALAAGQKTNKLENTRGLAKKIETMIYEFTARGLSFSHESR